MIPKGAEGIQHVATRIVTDLLPKSADAYTTSDLGMTAALVGLIGQDYDRAVDVLTADHREICSILREAESQVEDAPLAQRIRAAIVLETPNLRVHELNRRGDVEMRVLIDLHEHVERAAEEGADWAARIDGRIWHFLDDYVARRTYQSAF